MQRLAAVLPVHSHYDHVLDSAVVAARTGALLIGGASTAHVGRGHGLPDERIAVAVPGDPLLVGDFEVTLVESQHCPPDRYPGEITAPVHPRCGCRRIAVGRPGRHWCRTGAPDDAV